MLLSSSVGSKMFCWLFNLLLFLTLFNMFSTIDSCVDKMLYDINELAEYIAKIMEFYYPSMFKNLNDLCFPVQVNNLKAYYYLLIFIFINLFILI